MKIDKLIIGALLTTGILLSLGSCIKEEFEAPIIENIPFGTEITIDELRDLCPPGNTYKFTEDFSVRATVAMDDKSGNLYKEVYIQDEDSGVSVRLQNPGGLYQGDSIYINLKGTTLRYYRSTFQIDSVQVDKRVVKVAIKKYVEPELTTIPELKTWEHNSRLIKLENVQFVVSDTAKTYADAEGKEYGELTSQDEDGNTAMVRTSGFAKFANVKVPDGMGTIIAMATRYDDNLQLIIRSVNEVVFDQPRWNMFDGYTRNTIVNFKELYSGAFAKITSNIYIDGVVVGNDESGNLHKVLIIEDETCGIEVKINKTGLYKNYPVGTRIKVGLNGLYIGAYGGSVQVGGLYGGNFGNIEENLIASHFEIIETNMLVEPTLLTIADFSDQHIGKLIKLENVEFIASEIGMTFAGSAPSNRTLKDCSNKTVTVRTSNYAEFAPAILPPGKGTFIAVLGKFNSTYQLTLRYIYDADLYGERCP